MRNLQPTEMLHSFFLAGFLDNIKGRPLYFPLGAVLGVSDVSPIAMSRSPHTDSTPAAARSTSPYP